MADAVRHETGLATDDVDGVPLATLGRVERLEFDAGLLATEGVVRGHPGPERHAVSGGLVPEEREHGRAHFDGGVVDGLGLLAEIVSPSTEQVAVLESSRRREERCER